MRLPGRVGRARLGRVALWPAPAGRAQWCAVSRSVGRAGAVGCAVAWPCRPGSPGARCPVAGPGGACAVVRGLTQCRPGRSRGLCGCLAVSAGLAWSVAPWPAPEGVRSGARSHAVSAGQGPWTVRLPGRVGRARLGRVAPWPAPAGRAQWRAVPHSVGRTGPVTWPASCRDGRARRRPCGVTPAWERATRCGRPRQSSSTAVLCRTTRCVANSIRWADAPGSSGRSSMREASSAMCRSGWWTVVSGGLDHWASGTSS